ncbi:MAG: hypothetical protein PW786_10130, partial [Arachidicoccus sp.]|nr:hypothetical protein [Arachidicoccus sp.]
MKAFLPFIKIILSTELIILFISNSSCIKQCANIHFSDTTTIQPIDSIPNSDSTIIPPTDSTHLDSNSVQYSIIGEWTGTYYDSLHENPQIYLITIYDDYTMTFYGDVTYLSGGQIVKDYNSGDGKWKLSGTDKTNFTADIITKNGYYRNIGTEQTLTSIYNGKMSTFT